MYTILTGAAPPKSGSDSRRTAHTQVSPSCQSDKKDSAAAEYRGAGDLLLDALASGGRDGGSWPTIPPVLKLNDLGWQTEDLKSPHHASANAQRPPRA